MAVGAGAAQIIAQATKASGVIIRLDPEEWEQLVQRMEHPLIVVSEPGGMFSPNYQYLTTYKGLAFYTKSKTRVYLPDSADVINAKKIWVPE